MQYWQGGQLPKLSLPLAWHCPVLYQGLAHKWQYFYWSGCRWVDSIETMHRGQGWRPLSWMVATRTLNVCVSLGNKRSKCYLLFRVVCQICEYPWKNPSSNPIRTLDDDAVLPGVKKFRVQQFVEHSMHELTAQMCKQTSWWRASIQLCNNILHVIGKLKPCLAH